MEFSEAWELLEPCAGSGRDTELLGDPKELGEASSREFRGDSLGGPCGGSFWGDLGRPPGDGLLDTAASESLGSEGMGLECLQNLLRLSDLGP